MLIRVNGGIQPKEVTQILLYKEEQKKPKTNPNKFVQVLSGTEVIKRCRRLCPVCSCLNEILS